MRELRALMPRMVGEIPADTRERNRIATARRHSAGGAATLMMDPVADGVRARRVRVAGVVAAVAEDGAAGVVVVALAAGGREGV
jgi:hypothetical protein